MRTEAASLNQPPSELDDRMYSIFTTNKLFHTQLQQEQLLDSFIKNALQHTHNNSQIANGRLKRIQKHLCIENGVLAKSGCPVVPPSLRQFVVSEYHNVAHFATDKIYSLLKERLQFILSCVTCQRTNSDSHPPKAPLAKMSIPVSRCNLHRLTLPICQMIPMAISIFYSSETSFRNSLLLFQ